MSQLFRIIKKKRRFREGKINYTLYVYISLLLGPNNFHNSGPISSESMHKIMEQKISYKYANGHYQTRNGNRMRFEIFFFLIHIFLVMIYIKYV